MGIMATTYSLFLWTFWLLFGTLIRIHAGLEDAGDLIADLEQGFAAMRAAQ